MASRTGTSRTGERLTDQPIIVFEQVLLQTARFLVRTAGIDGARARRQRPAGALRPARKPPPPVRVTPPARSVPACRAAGAAVCLSARCAHAVSRGSTDPQLLRQPTYAPQSVWLGSSRAPQRTFPHRVCEGACGGEARLYGRQPSCSSRPWCSRPFLALVGISAIEPSKLLASKWRSFLHHAN